MDGEGVGPQGSDFLQFRNFPLRARPFLNHSGVCGWRGMGIRGGGGMDSQRTQVGDAFDNVLTHLARRYVCAGVGGMGDGEGGGDIALRL